MNLAIVNLTSGGMSGGYRKYLVKLLPLLAQDRRIGSIDVFLPAQLKGLATVGSFPVHTFESKADLRRIFENSSFDVAFIPTARYLDLGTPTVVMLRNMEPLTFPFTSNPLGEALRNLVRREAARQACTRATRVIAVSRHVAEVMMNRWHIPPGKIGLVYHGVESGGTASDGPPEGVGELTRREFLFTAGSIRPARGLEDLIGALIIMRERGFTMPLVVAGKPDPATRSFASTMMKKVGRIGLEVHWAGHLSPAAISWCMQRCAAFVMTTRAEACPNTALEAMSEGALCISSDNPPMPEFFADAAHYYRTHDAADLAAVLLRALEASLAERERLRRAARTRAAEFTWQKTALQTVAELVTATEGKSGVFDRTYGYTV